MEAEIVNYLRNIGKELAGLTKKDTGISIRYAKELLKKGLDKIDDSVEEKPVHQNITDEMWENASVQSEEDAEYG